MLSLVEKRPILLERHATKLYLRAPRPLGPKEIDGLLVPPGKACTMLTGYLITV